jgi:FkbM family methyltransferase
MKIKHLIIENLLLKFPKFSNLFFKYFYRNRLGKFLINFKKNVPLNWVYDIGAHKGEWSSFYKKTSLKESNFILFEANEHHKKDLIQKTFIFFIETLSDEKKDVNFYNNNNSSGDSYFRENTPNHNGLHPQKKKTRTLDEIVLSKNLPVPDLIKIDTQGSEIDILKGAKKTLETCKLVYLECPIIANFNNNNLNIFDYLNYLKNLNYIPQEICEIHYYHGYLIQVDILFVKKSYYKNINFDLDLLKSLY